MSNSTPSDASASSEEQADAHTSVKGTLAYRAKSVYAAVARGAGKALTAAHVLPKEPPSRDHRLKHWVTSLTKVHDSLAIAELGVPWWTYRSIDIVDAWLSARPHPIRVFEYGSGASTLWLADRADEVVSVEHHPGFSEVMRPVLAGRKNVAFHMVEAQKSDTAKVGSKKPGHDGLDFAEYVGTIDRVGGEFDLVVVDGRAREACMRAAIPHLAPGGIIVFDNSHRKRYEVAIESSGLVERRLRGLTPTLPYPDQTSLLTKRP